MSSEHENQAEELLDLQAEMLRRMERYYAPGGLFEAQQRRLQNDQEPGPLPPLESYAWVLFRQKFVMPSSGQKS